MYVGVFSKNVLLIIQIQTVNQDRQGLPTCSQEQHMLQPHLYNRADSTLLNEAHLLDVVPCVQSAILTYIIVQ